MDTVVWCGVRGAVQPSAATGVVVMCEVLPLPGKASARHHSGNGGNSGLMPPDACVDDGGTGLLDGTRKLHNLVPVGALRHQVQHGESVHNDEVIPTSGAVATIEEGGLVKGQP